MTEVMACYVPRRHHGPVSGAPYLPNATIGWDTAQQTMPWSMDRALGSPYGAVIVDNSPPRPRWRWEMRATSAPVRDESTQRAEGIHLHVTFRSPDGSVSQSGSASSGRPKS